MSDWGQLEQPQASDMVSGGYRLTSTHRNGREQMCQWDFIATPEGLDAMFEQKEQYEKWGFSGFAFWVLDEDQNPRPYEEQPTKVEAPIAEVEVTSQAPLSTTIVEAQESDTIRVHIACQPVLGVVWVGNDLHKAKRIFDRWTRTRQVSQAFVEFRHTDGSGWSIQYDNPELYWDRRTELTTAQAAGLPFFGVRA